jgi:PAS domain S-box-containing protein
MAMHIRSKMSLQSKLLLFMMSLVVFVGGSMGLLIRAIIFPYLIREMEHRGINVAQHLAESTRTFILMRDRASLTVSLFDEKLLEKNIVYIVVTDSEGRLLAHTLVGSAYADIVPSAPVIQPATDSELRLRAGAEDNDILDIYMPVFEGLYQIGTIRVGLDKRFMNRAIRELGFYHMGFIGFTTVVALISGVYLSRLIARPIRSLTRLAGEISRGNLNTSVSLPDSQHCWEILRCEDSSCPVYGDESVRCWLVSDRAAEAIHAEGRVVMKEKCRECIVSKGRAGDEIVQLADAFDHMTMRLRAFELELRRSEERYRLLFNRDPNPVFVVSQDSCAILDANERAGERYGHPQQGLIGMRFTDLGFAEDSALISTSFANLDPEQHQCSFLPRIRHRRQGDEAFWVSINFCYYDYLGTACVIATTTDITATLETETKLIQAGKMATLGEMAAGVAHELNQPLNAIKLGSDFLQTMIEHHRPIPDQDLQAVASEVSTQVDRAADIINHLRDFGRKSSVIRQRIDLNRPLRGVFTILGQQLRVHGIRVVTDLDEHLPRVLADENRIEQVLVNLINNARDAIEAKRAPGDSRSEGTLTVRSFSENDRVVVTVSDTGAGIPAAIRDRIFEPFFTTKDVGKGTGLGLSISYGIVRDYDGTIDFDAQEGLGSTFRLSFPRASEEGGNG